MASLARSFASGHFQVTAEDRVQSVRIFFGFCLGREFSVGNLRMGLHVIAPF